MRERWHFTPRAAAEAHLRRLSRIADDLLQRADGADALMTERLRAEAARLNEIGFTLTRCLCFDDIETAYRIVCGDSVDGETLGLTA